MSNGVNWQELASKISLRTDAFIGGKTFKSASGKTFESINPANGKVLANVAACDVADVDAAVKSARQAFESGVWSEMAPAARKTVLVKLSQLMLEHADELAVLETIDMGKPIGDARNIDIPVSAGCVQWMGECIDKMYDEVAPTPRGSFATVTREPLGVIGAVVPWNYPLLMAVWKIAPALAAGNSIVVKPAEQSPLSLLRLAELAIEAGVPEGVFNVIPGLGHEAGKAMGLHMDIDALTFTGSTQVGKYFLEYAGQSNMKRVSLECGGKTPHIVMKDCKDLDAAATAAAFGIFFNQGEVCNAGSRLLVEEDIKDEFMEKLLSKVDYFTPGDPLDTATKMGAIVTGEQLATIKGYVEKGLAEGGKLVAGGKTVREDTGGFFFEPTIFDGITNDMTIAQEEIFGPVLSTITFRGFEQAMQIANDTVYGLASAIWTADLDTAIKASRRIKAGSVWINCFDEGNITTPFGGFKQSGFGRDKSIHAIEKYSDFKTTWINIAG